jgi:hypothetical protein
VTKFAILGLYNYWHSGCYPSSYFQLKQRFGDWTLALSLDKKHSQLGPIDRASLSLRTPEPTQRRLYKTGERIMSQESIILLAVVIFFIVGLVATV